MANNGAAFDMGMKKAQVLIDKHIFSIMERAAKTMLSHASSPTMRGYKGFTGNTQTSYTAGLFKDGQLRYLIVQEAYKERPLMRKIKLGKTVHSSSFKRGGYTYNNEQKDVSRTGYANVDNKFGENTARDFIKAVSSFAGDKGWKIVVTTGTEYSEMLENALHLNVLTNTFLESGNIVKQSIAPMN